MQLFPQSRVCTDWRWCLWPDYEDVLKTYVRPVEKGQHALTGEIGL
jgi:hypothetical protein